MLRTSVLTQPPSQGGDHGRALALSGAAAAPGDLVLRVLPAAKVLQPALWRSRCHRCFATTSAPLSRCGRCRLAHYCSRACQQADWTPHHRAECSRLVQLEALRLRDAQDLGWHDADLDQEAVLLAALAQKLQLVDETHSMLELQTILARFKNNNFSITDELLLEIGAGCYLRAAMANHSCEPNCAVTFSAKEQRVEFRAMRAIAAGEELTHSYVDIALPRRDRQQRLEQQYHFQCKCVRCSQPLTDPQSRDANLDSDIDGVPEAQWSDERVRAVERAKAQLNEAASFAGDTSVDALQVALNALQTELHAENTTILQAYSTLFSAEMERGGASGAIAFGEHMLAFYRRAYPANHPLVGLHLFTLGDLHMQRRDPRARRLLREAQQVVQITHGHEHPFVALLQERIAAC
ncbi:hypothetical protein PybrP1_011637 [[Pythium] brassicae (nom. inval.)]|nr:hypothetical protein PybrP1_011637 [[Pythium] brassicae (nom. inval.)]